MNAITLSTFLVCVAALGCSNGGSTTDAGSDGSTGADVVSDVATSDAPSDATGDATDNGCAGNYKYCEDFESYPANTTIANGATLGPWKATVSGTGLVIRVDTTNAYRGKSSLHITVPVMTAADGGASPARGTLNQNATAGLIPGNNMFGRAMVFYSSANGNGLPLGVHSWLFNSAGTSQVADGGVTMNMGGGGAKMQLNYHPPAPLVEQSVQGGVMTTGTWHCVQWQYDGSGSPVADQGRVWVDGVQAVNVPQTQGWNFATPWNTFDFGFTHYQSLVNSVDVYLDEFALDGAMIPCP